MTITRLKVLLHYLKKNNDVKLKEMADFFFMPSYSAQAGRFIQKTKLQNEYKQVYFNGIQNPLYYPADLNAHSLNQVIVESFNPANWHYYEMPQTTVMPDDVVVDCGAAEGLFALKVQNRCKHIYLVEPLQKFIQALQKTFAQVDNVTILPFAVSDKAFTTKIKSSDISSSLSDEGEGEDVEVKTLDQLFFEKDIAVTYLKMDLEGYDYKALVGAEKLIKKYRPKIAITTYHEKDHAALMKEFLKRAVPEYNIVCKGIYQETGSPVMLHAWL